LFHWPMVALFHRIGLYHGAVDEHGQGILHLLANIEDSSWAEYISGSELLDSSPEEITRKDDFGNPPVLYACRTISPLLDLLLDTPTIFVTNNEGMGAFHYLSTAYTSSLRVLEDFYRHIPKIVKKLNVSGVPHNLVDNFGLTPFANSVRNGDFFLANQLFDLGYSFHDSEGTTTPLHLLAVCSSAHLNTYIAQDLLRKILTNTRYIDIPDMRDNTPLILAIKFQNEPMALALKHAGANPRLKNLEDESPLSILEQRLRAGETSCSRLYSALLEE